MRIEISRRALIARKLDGEDMLRFVFGLREIEIVAYRTVCIPASRAAMDVETVARRIGRDRTTAQRSLCNLVSAGLVVRHVEPHSRLFYTYEAIPPAEMKEAVRRYLKEWYERLDKVIDSL